MLCALIAGMDHMMIKTYSEMIQFNSFIERFNYLRLDGFVGRDTFGFDRYLNQMLYRDSEWLRTRDIVILRDDACDLGIKGREIYKYIIVHHMNPITKEDVLKRNPKIFNPEFLITTVLRTHNAIHYGDEQGLIQEPLERSKNDTTLWRR